MSREPKREPLSALAAERDRAKRELTCCEHRLKILAKQERELTRKERTHRLCARGGMVESCLNHPELWSNDQVAALLHMAFAQKEMQNLKHSIEEGLEREQSGEV